VRSLIWIARGDGAIETVPVEPSHGAEQSTAADPVNVFECSAALLT